MKNSSDIKTQKFIDSIEILDDTKYQILQKLRSIVFGIYPKTNERIMYGGILFSLNEDYGGVFVYENHVSFEFSNGYKFEDPKNLLEGKGKYRRHLKFKSLEDIAANDVKFFVNQAVNIKKE